MEKTTFSRRLICIVLALALVISCGVFCSTAAEITTPVTEGPVFPEADIHLDMSLSSDKKTAYDVSGNGYNATVKGTLTSVAGPDGDATALGGFKEKTNVMYLPSTEDLDFSKSDYSISVTFKTDAEPTYASYRDMMLVSKRNTGAGKREFQLYVQGKDHSITFITRDANDAWVWCYGPEVTLGEWHTAIATVKDDVMQLYFDGELVDTEKITAGRAAATDAEIGIGVDPNSSTNAAFPGVISDVKLANEGLSTDVPSYFAPTVTPDIHLDMADSLSFGKDVSGNGNHATVVGELTAAEGHAGDTSAVSGFAYDTNGMYIPSPEDMSFSDDFSVSVTFKTDTQPTYTNYKDMMLVEKRNTSEGKREFQVYIQGKDHTITFITRDTTKNDWVWCYGPEVTLGEWHTAVATVRGNVMQLYYDGVLVSTTVITGSRAASTDASIGIGFDPYAGSAFPGAISDVKISDEAAEYPAVEMSKDNTAEVRTMAVGEYIFSDRIQNGYNWGETLPEFFRGKKFNFGAIGGGVYTVKTGGLIYALTPDETVSGAAPQEATLRKYGFTRLEGLDFQAFGTWNANYVHAYCKQVVPGEVLDIGKWAIILADDLKIESTDYIENWANNSGEVLYNGITLPEEWPPRSMDKRGSGEMPVPYLDAKPEVININTGRQLFVDDFLIESTDLTRAWHKAKKYDGNPVMKPETEQELGRQYGSLTFAPMAAPFSGGVWYDSTDGLFKMWYCAGWFDGTALAVSKDGINWERPEYDVEPGTNLIRPLDNAQRDSAAVIMDPFASANEKFKMFLWSRPQGGEVYTSADGIHWGTPTSVAETGDRTTIFYNPFRSKWVYSIRSFWSARSRSYSECDDLIKGAGLQNTVCWARTDNLDLKDPVINQTPSLYNLDAVAYESVMLGAFSILIGPDNGVCAETGIPKNTELHMGFSRDGFHWSRSEDRTAFIGATQQEGSWERGYIHSNASICLVNDDELWFYYTGFEGDESKKGSDYPAYANGMYCNASTGLATLRRDGFASMGIDTAGTLTTETVTFDGKYLFVNADAKSVKAEILDESGKVIEGYGVDDCVAVSGDTTKAMLSFGRDLSSLSGKNVKFRFYVEEGELYSFWVTDDAVNGASNGYLAGGSVGQEGLVDTAESYVAGDLNSDGSIDGEDRVILRKKLIGSETGDINKNVADVNGDGYVNICDLVAIETKIKKQ